jgi:hypothetical protein
MWSQFTPNLSWYSCVVVSVFLLWFPPNLSCLQNNPPENNVEQILPNLSCLQNNPPFLWEEKLIAPLIATPNGEVRK